VRKVSVRVLVAGCGAVGSVFACLLRVAGHRVSVLGRAAQVAAIRARGIRVTGIWGHYEAQGFDAHERAAELGEGYDAVLVTCKSYQLPELLAEMGDRAAPWGVAISLQNGLGNVDHLARLYGQERVLAGRVIFGAEVPEPGIVRVTVEAEPVLIGNPSGGRDERAERWAEVFRSAGVNAAATNDVTAALWAKVFYNAALNPMGALLGFSYGKLAADPERRRIMNHVIGEAYSVARAEGVDLAWASVGEYLDVFYGRLVPATAGHRSSMLQDIERNRRTEIDAICGEIVRRGDAHGIDAVVNRLLKVLISARSAQS
jgi:2-dehydropantoate 2-reductase